MATRTKSAARPTFWSRTARPGRSHAPKGNREMDTWEVEIDIRGHKSLVKTGKTNIYDRIQASLESTKIENIIRRATAGDPTALAATTGKYLDVSDAPRSLAEIQNVIAKIGSEFEHLPLEIRKLYDFSPEKYVADYGSVAWAKNLGYELPKQTEPTVPETGNNGGAAE